jgi:hypothetical protein
MSEGERLRRRPPLLAPTEAMFKAANETVMALACERGVDWQVPLLCECARRDCTTIIRVLPGDYARIRRHSSYLLCSPSHDKPTPGTRPVDTLGGVLIVEREPGPAGDAGPDIGL